jgi:hypothetical protein
VNRKEKTEGRETEAGKFEEMPESGSDAGQTRVYQLLASLQ